MPRYTPAPVIPLLNIDLGELPDEAEELYECAQLANIACGGHAGDDASIAAALARCGRHGVQAGAHPSYPDRAGFGRVHLPMAPDALRASVAEQCERLAALAERAGIRPGHVKPHGALYHAAAASPDVARAVVAGAVEALGYDIVVLGPPGGALLEAASEAGVGYAREGFADRGLRADGSLVPRGEPGALIADPVAAAAQARALAIRRDFETLCVHGDSPGAVALAQAVRSGLAEAGVTIAPFVPPR
jgi:UPF0271 protein